MLKQNYTLNDIYDEILTNKKKTKCSLGLLGLSIASFLLSTVSPILYASTLSSLFFMYDVVRRYSVPMNLLENECLTSKEYLELEKQYYIFLEEIKNLLVSLDITNSSEIFVANRYLTLNGYLSIDHNFSKINKKYDGHFQAISIIEGNGVCRQLSVLLSDLLKNFGYDAYAIRMKFENQKIATLDGYSYGDLRLEEIETESESELDSYDSLILVIAKEMYGDYNHVTTLLADGDSSYIMDSMNNTMYYIKNGLVFPILNFDEPIITDLDFAAFETRSIPNVSSINISSFENIVNQYMEAKKKCEDSHFTFEKFYREHKELYREILTAKDDFKIKYKKIERMVYPNL